MVIFTSFCFLYVYQWVLWWGHDLLFHFLCIWVNFITTSRRDLTIIIVSKGNHPKMAEQFRLVKYCNLPRCMVVICEMLHRQITKGFCPHQKLKAFGLRESDVYKKMFLYLDHSRWFEFPSWHSSLVSAFKPNVDSREQFGISIST